jgi:hypothetical protein
LETVVRAQTHVGNHEVERRVQPGTRAREVRVGGNAGDRDRCPMKRSARDEFGFHEQDVAARTFFCNHDFRVCLRKRYGIAPGHSIGPSL